MDDSPEVIRQQMEETRSALTDKIERLEQAVTEKVQTTTAAVTDTVESVRDAVNETVETVKGTMSDTVDSVKDTFDIPGYFREYPWASFAAAVGAGVAGGMLLGGRPSAGRPQNMVRPFFAAPPPAHGGGSAPTNGSAPPVQAARPEPRASMFDDELGKLKGMAVGAAFGLVRTLLRQSMPSPLVEQVSDIVDSVTRKLGGEPIRGNLLESITDRHQAGNAGHEGTGVNARNADRLPATY